MHPLMNAAGHRLITPTYTGLGEREHLASPSNDLATGVADRARDQVSQLIYLDAFVPRDGQSLFDLLPPEALKRMLEAMKAGDGWRVPPNPCPTDTSEADLKWILPRRLPQSVRTAEMPLREPPPTSSSMPLHDSSFGSSRPDRSWRDYMRI